MLNLYQRFEHEVIQHNVIINIGKRALSEMTNSECYEKSIKDYLVVCRMFVIQGFPFIIKIYIWKQQYEKGNYQMPFCSIKKTLHVLAKYMLVLCQIRVVTAVQTNSIIVAELLYLILSVFGADHWDGVLPSTKTVLYLSMTYEKLPWKGEPYRFSGYR